MFIVSHHNIDREIIAKERFIKTYLPKVEYIPVPFHMEKYEDGKRRSMTNKAQYVKKILGLHDIVNYTLIDDSNTNGKNWLDNNGAFIKYAANGQVVDSNNEIENLFPYDIISRNPIPLLYSDISKKQKGK